MLVLEPLSFAAALVGKVLRFGIIGIVSTVTIREWKAREVSNSKG